MASSDPLTRPEPGFSLPMLERSLPPPPPALVAARVEAHSAPGDVVLDLNGRGGWIARAAIDRQRRAVTLESGPLARLLAEIVLRPPDVRHLDAAFQSLGASPHGDTSLRLSIGEPFATRCATCGRKVVADEFTWEAPGERSAAPRITHKQYRCPACRDPRRTGDQRQAPVDEADVEWAGAPVSGAAVARTALAERFPVPAGGEPLVAAVLDLHTPRQLAALAAILGRIEGDLRAAPVEAALRLAFLHAVLPASRLAGSGARASAIRIGGGKVRLGSQTAWRERNPWLAFEDGFRTVRGFVQRLEGGALPPVQARFGEDLRSLGEGAATAVVRVATPSALGGLALEAEHASGLSRPRVRLVLGQPPVRPNQERLAAAWHGTAWALGREAAATLPIEPLLAASWRAPWAWQAAALRRSLETAAPLLAKDGRIVLLLDGSGPEPLASVALAAAGAGCRLLEARLGEPGEDVGGIVELAPPGAAGPHTPRTRANVPLPPEGPLGDTPSVPGSGLFSPPQRPDARPFSAADAARTITESAVDVLRARGEPAPTERLFGEVLVGLDRAGLLRRLATAANGEPAGTPEPDAAPGGETTGGSRAPAPSAASVGRSAAVGDVVGSAVANGRHEGDPVERLVALVHDELARPTQRRIREIEPGRWWLADREDVASAAAPLSDRVEWAVYSLLSTAGRLSEAAFFARIGALFAGHDLPDEALVRACLESYRSRSSTPDELVTSESLPGRSAEHAELIADLVDGGHRLGMQVTVARREQGRVVDGRSIADRLDDRELGTYLPAVARGPLDDLESIDVIWHVRGKATLVFEVEWTAMLGEPVLRRHARISQDERLVRFLVIPPERTELVRHKLERSPVLRAALEAGNWHILKWNHLRAFLARDPLSLGDLEPFLGLDPLAERSGEQLPLFGGEGERE